MMKHLWIAALFSLSATAWGEQATLNGQRWSVAVDLETMQVSGAGMTISAALPVRCTVKEVVKAERAVSWALPDRKLNVEMRLEDDDALVVRIRAAEAGTFTWPIVRAGRALVLPLFEGLYVPVDDPQWAKFLIQQGPISSTDGLSMPFWGTCDGNQTLTYILTNPFNNELELSETDGRLCAALTHAFTPNRKVKAYGLRIILGDASPVTPAKNYRKSLIDSGRFVSMQQKIEKTPAAAKLLGAAHVYLWGDGVIAADDIVDAKAIARRIVEKHDRVWTAMDEEHRKLVSDLPTKEWADQYDKRALAEELSRIFERDELHQAYGDLLKPVETWGDGFSLKMMAALSTAGLDRLWLGSPNWSGLAKHPEMVKKAIELGYLVGPYDSFHSIHSPDERDTWETAQFDRTLYERGAVVKADGTKKAGFKKKGFILSPIAARPDVEKRVTRLMEQFRCNSWFVDCDATGEVFDDYSPQHLATQEDDLNARRSRLAWIRDTFGAVIGSEGGWALVAPEIHFGHGIMTPVIGWGDPELTDRQSKYYLGAYYPPDGPAVFFRQTPLKEEYRRAYADPRFRLPLYEIVFHDSVIATHQWGYGSLKFDDPYHARELLELLYNVPPLYHLNLAEWTKRKEQIQKHYAFFSPLHREVALLAMTDFQWLSDDRLVQRILFGAKLEMVANFRDAPFKFHVVEIPPQSIALIRDGGEPRVFSP